MTEIERTNRFVEEFSSGSFGLGVVNQYELIKELGAGSQSVVYKALDTDTKGYVAIKALIGQSLMKHKRLLGSDGYKVKNEVAVMKLLNHPSLVTLIEIIDDAEKDVLYIVMELVRGQPLFTDKQLLNIDRFSSFSHGQREEPVDLTLEPEMTLENYPEPLAKMIFQQMCVGVAYLHNHAIIHKDIKPQNILVEYVMDASSASKHSHPTALVDQMKSLKGSIGMGAMEVNVKICDFGLSSFSSTSKGDKLLGVDDLTSADSGTTLFLPPEALAASRGSLAQQYNGRPGDIWSLGITLYAMIFGRLPFYRTDDIINVVLPDTFRKLQPLTKEEETEASAELRQFLCNLLEKDPEKRPTIDMLLTNPWLTGKGPSIEGLIDKQVIEGRKVAVDEQSVTRAVSAVKKSFWSFMMSEKIKELKHAKELVTTVSEDILPKIDAVDSDLSQLQQALGLNIQASTPTPRVPLSSQKYRSRRSRKFDHLYDKNAQSSSTRRSRLEGFLSTDFKEDLLSRLEARHTHEAEIKLCEQVLRIINNDYPTLFSMNRTKFVSNRDLFDLRLTHSLQKAQLWEVNGNNYGAAVRFDQLCKSLTTLHLASQEDNEPHSEVRRKRRIRQQLGEEALSPHFSPKAVKLLGNDIFKSIIGGKNGGISDRNERVVVIIGAGYAGMECAKVLDERLFPNKGFEDPFLRDGHTLKHASKKGLLSKKCKVILLDERDFFLHKIACPRAAVIGDGFAQRALIPTYGALTNGEVKCQKVVQLNPETQTLLVAKSTVYDDKSSWKQGETTKPLLEEVSYDYLVCATGTRNVSVVEPPDQLREKVSVLDWYHEVANLVEHAKIVAVFGSGPTAIELCGEMKHMYPGKEVMLLCSTQNLFHDNQADTVLPGAFSDYVVKHLKTIGVKVAFQTDIDRRWLDSVGQQQHSTKYINCWETAHGNQGILSIVNQKGADSVRCDLLLFATGYQLNNAFYPPSWLNRRGELRVDEYLQVVGAKQNFGGPQYSGKVFAVGDITDVAEARLAENARKQGEHVAKAIINAICKKKLDPYRISKPAAIAIPFGPDKGCTLLKTSMYGNRVTSKLKGKTLKVKEYWKLMNQENNIPQEIHLDTLHTMRSHLKSLNKRIDEQQTHMTKLQSELSIRSPTSVNASFFVDKSSQQLTEDKDKLLLQIRALVDQYNNFHAQFESKAKKLTICLEDDAKAHKQLMLGS